MICYYVKSILIDTDHKYASRKLGTTSFEKLFSNHLIFTNDNTRWLQYIIIWTVKSGQMFCLQLFIVGFWIASLNQHYFLYKSNSNKGSYKNWKYLNMQTWHLQMGQWFTNVNLRIPDWHRICSLLLEPQLKKIIVWHN